MRESGPLPGVVPSAPPAPPGQAAGPGSARVLRKARVSAAAAARGDGVEFPGPGGPVGESPHAPRASTSEAIATRAAGGAARGTARLDRDDDMGFDFDLGQAGLRFGPGERGAAGPGGHG